MQNKLIKGIKNPRLIFMYFLGFKICRIIPDSIYLKIKFRLKMMEKLNLNNPKTFNEKLQWLKLNDRKPEYKNMVDKYEVRKYIADKIGEEYLIPLLGVWDKFEDIDFEQLPNQFVLKPNHTSGNVFICKDKSKINYEKLKKEINSWLNRKYYWVHREWPYKNIKPRIICEKYMVDESGVELKDYKFFCFNGEPKIIQVISERKNGQYYINHFDLEWNRVEIRRKNHKENKTLFSKKPNELEKMITISKELCKSMLFARIDLYATEKGVYFGEITFFPASGYMGFEDERANYLLGSWIRLPIDEN
jgi:hypothetical protein